MNKIQALLVVGVLVLMLNFTLPMLLSDYEIGYDIPFLGHISLWDPNSVFGTFLAGGVIAAFLMFIMITEKNRSKRN